MLDLGNQWQAFTQGHSHQSGDTKRELTAILRTAHTFLDGLHDFKAAGCQMDVAGGIDGYITRVEGLVAKIEAAAAAVP